MKFGASVRRVEDQQLLVGGGRFVDDIRLTDALHVAFVRSTHAHARVIRVDSRGADVFTARDLPPGHDAIAFGSWLLPNARVREAADPVVRSHALPLLARDRVRYVGQPVAAVVANSAAAAEDAASVVEVDYEPLAAVVDPEEALAPGAARLHDDWPDNLAASFRLKVGD